MNMRSTSKYIGKAAFAHYWWKVLYRRYQASPSKKLRREMRKTVKTLCEFRMMEAG